MIKSQIFSNQNIRFLVLYVFKEKKVKKIIKIFKILFKNLSYFTTLKTYPVCGFYKI
jgi:hypothetical protein